MIESILRHSERNYALRHSERSEDHLQGERTESLLSAERQQTDRCEASKSNNIEIYLSLGSNLGDREGNIALAVKLLDQRIGVRHSALSKIIETEPWGGAEGGAFLNAAVRYEVPRAGQDAGLYCRALLEKCKEIERELGRKGGPEYFEDGTRHYRARTIDIDILFYGRESIVTEGLTIPHPLIAQRDFVKVPLAEILSGEEAFYVAYLA